MSTLILLRHGESRMERVEPVHRLGRRGPDREGVAEAGRAGLLLADSGVLPSVVHTSVMRRAIRTTNLALDVCDRHWIPVRRSWRLNERHYRSAARQEQEADARGVRPGAVHAVAPFL